MAEVLDHRALANLLAMTGDDPDFVDELADAYLADAPVQLAALRAAASSGSPSDAVRPAHTLKGNSLNLGAAEVAELARRIEEDARQGVNGDLSPRIEALAAAFERAQAALASARARRWTVD